MRNNWSTNMKIRNVETITHIRYTCQLFLTYKREIFILGVLGFFEDDTIISEDSRRSPKSSEDARSLPKTSEVCRRRSYQSYPTPSLRMHIKTSSLPVLFTSKSEIARKVLSFIHFYTWFSFLTWVWVNIFLEIVSSKTATTHIFQSGMRNWPASVSQCEIAVFNPQHA